jgi:protein transport protein SEC9
VPWNFDCDRWQYVAAAHLCPSICPRLVRCLDRIRASFTAYFAPTMKKLQKKPTNASEDANRSALFGNRDRRPSPDSRSANPYAQGPDPSTQRPDPYARGQYARDPYASQSYQGSQPQQSSRPSAPREYSNESIDSNRNALFGNRPPPQQVDAYGRSRDPYGGPRNEPDHYDEYQQQAQDDDEDVEAIKQEIRFTKQESLSSTRNAIRIASEAEETGRNTLSRLGAQSEKLSGVEKNLDVSAAHSRIAEDKARELKKLNRSIFAINVSNPFDRKARAEEEERKIVERHEMEREERERNRKDAYESAQRVNAALNKPGSGRKPNSREPTRSTIAARSAYSFEGDEDDVHIEKDIDANLNTLSDITTRLKGLALATQVEIESQNKKLDQIADKVLTGCYLAKNNRVMCLILGFT